MIKLPIRTTSLIHFSLKGWGNVLFELGSERVKDNDKAMTTEGWMAGRSEHKKETNVTLHEHRKIDKILHISMAGNQLIDSLPVLIQTSLQQDRAHKSERGASSNNM